MLVKQGIDVSFAQGLDTKTDPKRLNMGKFDRLENTVFNKGGLLQKRNGYMRLASLPDTTYSYLTTFKDNLTAIGPDIAAYNEGNANWVAKGSIQPLSLDTLSVIRNNLNQTQLDIAVARNGLACVTYLESDGTTTTAKYAIFDSVTGQNISAPAAIPVASGTVTGGTRVFILGNYFIIVFTNVITAVSHLQYISVSINNTSRVSANTDIAAAYVSAGTLSWDGFVYGTRLYIAYNNTSGGQSIKVTYLTQSFTVATASTFSGYIATMMSVTVDSSNSLNPLVYVSFYDSAGTTGYTLVVDTLLRLIMNPVEIVASGDYLNITSVAKDGSCYIYLEADNAYSWAAGIPTNFIHAKTVTPLVTTFESVFSSGDPTITASSATSLVNGMYLIDNTTATNITAGTTFTVSGTTLTLSANAAGNSASSPGDTLTAATVSSFSVIIRSVGLASKAFIYDDTIYFLSSYQSPYQSTYFLINASESTSASPVVAAKLAYSNGGGYLTTGLPSVTVRDDTAFIGYRLKDLIQAVNKDTAVPSGTQVAGVYSQTGLSMVSFSFGTASMSSSEIGANLNIAGGFLWMYDGYLPVENNFFLWPDTDQTTPTNTATWSATGGSIAAQPDGATNTKAYYYQFCYEWTDNQGNWFRSAPSIPIYVTTTGSGTSGSITVNVPTLRLTMKVANPVKVVIYRWSVAQPIYYQTTSISSPLLNSTTTDSVQFVDTNSDATILGNNILYTTGGVVENLSPPATDITALFDSRLWLVDSEDRNLLWFSKQILQATPVEMSDLFTVFVSPTISVEGSTGEITSIFPMDDKLIIGKANAFFYINGVGPDNTGANNQYSEPIFITATVGSSNQNSMVLIPQGLMFESSNKGIWLLDRGLGTSYIGAPVESFTQGASVTSAVSVPGTNQVRFTLSTGITLMYDYYYDQWGTFTGVPAVSSTIYQGMHTFINQYGRTFQEAEAYYLDGSVPVTIAFQTGPLRLGDLQQYQRAYFFYLLGTYYSPHKLSIGILYDYERSPSESHLITPINYSTPYGSGDSQSPYGQGNPYGGPSNLEQWRVFLSRQRCMAFAIRLQEIYDVDLGAQAGAGLSLSGLNVVLGFKKAFRPQDTATSVG